jgi:RNase P/RNase MRP subunit p29
VGDKKGKQTGTLIGTVIRVENQKNISLAGITGKVIDETKNTLLIMTKKGEKRILKKQVEIKKETGMGKEKINEAKK